MVIFRSHPSLKQIPHNRYAFFSASAPSSDSFPPVPCPCPARDSSPRYVSTGRCAARLIVSMTHTTLINENRILLVKSL